MKKFILILIISCCLFAEAQEKEQSSYFQLDYFYGNIIEHAPQLKPIIQSHPSGFIFSWNKKNIENTQFNQTYNFPDVGFSASYQDFKTETLGEVYGVYTHYNFYLTNRTSKNQVKLTTAMGLAYSTSPFDKVSNSKNWALGSHINAALYVRLNYARAYILDRIGLNAGLGLIHYSNGSFNTPNLGINTLNVFVGANYDLDDELQIPERKVAKDTLKYPIKFNSAFRFGFNESKINNSGLKPFYTVSLFGTKKLNYVSTISFGTDLFFPTYMKDYIEYENSIYNTDSSADWKRVGIFIGHELNLNKFSLLTEIGAHVYYPYEYESVIYERFGFRKKFGEHLFADLTLKINMFRAEGVEFGIGYKF
ncbi:MAG: hypothetical protein BM563_12035 [Bacteroidetes bacterium MedPE-SWsnd-G1]|nr:MAG: hypothetical protein BM563_12035 [Bacteroidetes bacterium MedPE-SWsnd-G1]